MASGPRKTLQIAGFSASTRISTPVDKCPGGKRLRASRRTPKGFVCRSLARTACGQPEVGAVLYTGPPIAFPAVVFSREADLPAKCAPPEAQARLPRPHGHAGRPRDPEAPPRE